MDADETPCIDPANSLINPTAAQLATGTIDTPQGKLHIWTFRTPSTSMSLFLTHADAKQWHKVLGENIEEGSDLAVAPAGLLTAGPTMPLNNARRNGQPPSARPLPGH